MKVDMKVISVNSLKHASHPPSDSVALEVVASEDNPMISSGTFQFVTEHPDIVGVFEVGGMHTFEVPVSV